MRLQAEILPKYFRKHGYTEKKLRLTNNSNLQLFKINISLFNLNKYRSINVSSHTFITCSFVILNPFYLEKQKSTKFNFMMT